MEFVATEKTLLPLRYVLPLVVLVEGFVSIAIEILTIRQLLPVAGGSVIVTSLIIGFFLLFLACGYHRGGKLHQNLPKVLRINFFIAAIWLGVGLSYGFILLFFYFVQKITGPQIVYPLIAYLFLIIAPLIFMLGQTIPITMNMVLKNRSAGSIGGNTLGLSTLGSFLGAILTTLVLMYFLGVAWTVIINFILLILLVLMLVESRLSFVLYLGMALVALFFIYEFQLQTEKKLFVTTNNYANYQVVDNQSTKFLFINDSPSSSIDKNKKGFLYIESIKKILFDDLKLRDASILVLGAGGFTLTAKDTYQNQVTYVDVDSQIKKVVFPRFLEHMNSSFVADDARHYLQTTHNLYEAIVTDVYSDLKTMPAYFLTQEYMRSVKARLASQGVAIFNIIANPMLADAYSKRVDNTIRSVFERCMVTPGVYADKITNILYVCSNKSNQSDKVIYSDNFNNSTTDSFNW